MKLYVKRGEFGEFQKAKIEFENFDDWVSLMTALRLAKGMDQIHEIPVSKTLLNQVEEAYTDHELEWEQK